MGTYTGEAVMPRPSNQVGKKSTITQSPARLIVEYVENLNFDGVLLIFRGFGNALLLRQDIQPDMAFTIRAEASDIVKKEVDDNHNISGKAWVNGQRLDIDERFPGTINEDSITSLEEAQDYILRFLDQVT